MSDYRRALVAVDITGESRQVAAAADRIAGVFDAELHIVHVVDTAPPPVGADFVPDLVASLTAQVRAHAKSHVDEIATEFGIPEQRRHVVVDGRPAAVIRRVAEQNGADLIVVGSHGRHGVGLLLGSTASGVLHGAGCDVLAVRVRPAEDG